MLVRPPQRLQFRVTKYTFPLFFFISSSLPSSQNEQGREITEKLNRRGSKRKQVVRKVNALFLFSFIQRTFRGGRRGRNPNCHLWFHSMFYFSNVSLLPKILCMVSFLRVYFCLISFPLPIFMYFSNQERKNFPWKYEVIFSI